MTPAAVATLIKALTANNVTLANLLLQAMAFLVLFLSLDFFWGRQSGLLEKSLIIYSTNITIILQTLNIYVINLQ